MLKYLMMPARSAAMISSLRLPTPENATLFALPPAASTRGELAARNDVESGAKAGKGIGYGEVRIGLDRAQQMSASCPESASR